MSSRFLVVLLAWLIGLTPFAIDMYLPSMPAIARELAAPPQTVQWTVSIYLVFFALPQLFFGPLSDAMGRRFAIFCGISLFVAGSLLAAVAPNIEVLLAARALQGTGSAAVSVTVPALLKDRFTGAEYTRNIGVMMIVMSVAPLIAPIMGGFIFSIGGWRSVFYVLVVIALAAALVFGLTVGESLPRERRRPLNLGELMHNYRRLFSDRYAVGLALSVGAMVAGLMTFIAGSPFVFIEYYGVAPEHYGFLFSANVVAMSSMTYLNNRLIHYFTNAALLRGSVVMVTLASVFLALVATINAPPLWLVMAATLCFIANQGVVTTNIQVILLSRFQDIAGASSAMLGSVRFGIGALGGVILSLFHQESSAPLTGVMAACGLAVLVAFMAAGKPAPMAKAERDSHGCDDNPETGNPLS